MHQNQFMAVWEELGGPNCHPIPNSFPQQEEDEEFSYSFLTFGKDSSVVPPAGEWTEGPNFDGKGTFTSVLMEPVGACSI